MCKSDSVFHYLQSSALFTSYFLIRFISKRNDTSSGRNISFIEFHSVNVKEHWAYLAEKNSRPLQYLGCHENVSMFCFEQQNHVMIFKFSF